MTYVKEFTDKLESLLTSDEEETIQILGYFHNLAETNAEQEQVLESLFTILETNTRVEVRRKVVTVLKKEFILLENVRSTEVKRLLAILKNEQSEDVRKSFTRAIGDNCYDAQLYFLQELLPWFDESDIHAKIVALDLMGYIGFDVAIETFQITEKDKKKLLAELKKCMQDKNTEVRHAALHCTTTFANCIHKEDEHLMSDLAPIMLNVLQNDLNAGDQDSAVKTIGTLVDAIDSAFLFKKSPETIISAMYQIAKTQQLKSAVRVEAIQFLASFGESLRQTRKKIPKFNETIVTLCFDLIVEGVDENIFDNDVDEAAKSYEDTTVYDGGLETLDRLGISASGKTFAPIVLKLIDTYIKKPDWRSKVAAVMAIAHTAESCKEQYLPLLPKFVTEVLKLTKDNCARLRYAAIYCITQLCTDLSPTIQENHSGEILEGLIASLEDADDHVRKDAAQAVMYIVEKCPAEVVAPYLDALVQKLITQIKSDQVGTKTTSLMAIAAIAGSSKVFTQYYDQIMPILKHEIEQNPTDEQLRDRLYECTGIILKETGKEKAEVDAEWYMDALLKQPRNDMIQYSIVRVIQCVGKDFHKYTAQVIPIIMEDITNYKPDEIMPIDVLDGEEIQFKSLKPDSSGEFATSVMKELLEVVPEDCKDCLPELITIILRNISETQSLHYYVGSMEIIPTVVKCIREGSFTEQEKGMYANQFMTSAIGAMMDQHSMSLLEACVDTITDLLKLDVENKFERSQLANPLNLKFQQMIAHASRPPFDDEEADEDEEEDEKQQEDQKNVLSALCELLGELVGCDSIEFDYTPIMNDFAPVVGPDAKYAINYAAMLATCIILEKGKEKLQSQYYVLVPYLITLFDILADDDDSQQVFVFVLGVIAMHGGENADHYLLPEINRLFDIMENDPAGAVLTNAVSAVLKIIKYCPTVASKPVFTENLDKIWKHFPLSDKDEIEKKLAYRNLVDIVIGNETLRDANKDVLKKIFVEMATEDEKLDSVTVLLE